MPSKTNTKKTAVDKLPAEPTIFETAGSEEDFRIMLPEAMKLDARDVLTFRADAALARHNGQLGATAVLEHKERLARELPKLDLSHIRSILHLGPAVVFSAQAADQTVAPSGDLRAQMARSRQLRSLMMSSADSLAAAGIFDVKVVAKIHEGTGALDTAADCVALASLFARYSDEVRGKTPVTAAQVREASELGSMLVGSLRPRGAKRVRARDPKAKDAAEARDRLWTLMVQRYEKVWQAGAWIWGYKVDEHVPALQSRAVSGRPPKLKALNAVPNPVAPTGTAAQG
jgi:hypothetical protein